MGPAVSVIIPHLNQPDMLPRCLESIANQTYDRDRIETIVVDNGSRTAPEDVVRRFTGVALAVEKEPGPGPARNLGVKLSHGEILAFIDADCTADENWLAAIVRRFESASAKTILGGDVRIAYDNAQQLSALEAYESVFSYRQEEYIRKVGFSGTGNLAVRRPDFDAIGPFPGIEVAEDRVWGKRASALSYRVEYVTDMVIYHPARKTFAEIFTKWDRHARHDFEEWRQRGQGKFSWLLRTAAIAAFTAVDVGKVLASNRLSGFGARGAAIAALMRIRAYRVRLMTALALGLASPEVTWNR